jgi:hypothetical protein
VRDNEVRRRGQSGEVHNVNLELGTRRLAIEIESLDDSSRCSAFAYAKSRELATPVHSGYLDDDQDRRFIPPSERPEPSG